MSQDSDMRARLIKRFYARFVPKAYDENSGAMPDLVKNDQHPEALIISCVDSRVSPGVIFKMDPGEALIHRHIAGLVPAYDPNWEKDGESPSVAATIEFAVRNKKVKTLIIKGHTHCGGIKAYIDGNASPLINGWMHHARAAFSKVDKSANEQETLRAAEQEVIKYSYHNLMAYPAVREAMMNNELTVEAWIHDIEKGTLLRFDPKNENFVEISPDGKDFLCTHDDHDVQSCSHN